jgi:outer membrane protein
MSKHALATLPARLALLAMCACPAAMAQKAPLPDTNFAAVSTARLMTESRLAKEAGAKIIAEFSVREKAIQDKIAQLRAMTGKFETDAEKLSDRERTARTRELIDLDQEVQRLQAEFRDDLRHRQNEERSIIARKAYEIIIEIEKAEHIDIVLQNPLWFSPRIDITDKVLKRLDR